MGSEIWETVMVAYVMEFYNDTKNVNHNVMMP
jgi:hypothetical protein